MRFKNFSGQTLVELIAAAFVLAVGLVGVLALTTANVRSQTIGNIRLAGAQLAREGVELARNIRDTNWMLGKSWDDGLKDPDNFLACAVMTEGIDQFRFVDCSNQLYLDQFAIYRFEDRFVQMAKQPKEAVKAGYYRIIRFDPICLNKTEQEFAGGNLDGTQEFIAEGETGCGDMFKAGIRVTSEVSWLRGSGMQSVKVVEQMYNWR